MMELQEHLSSLKHSDTGQEYSICLRNVAHNTSDVRGLGSPSFEINNKTLGDAILAFPPGADITITVSSGQLPINGSMNKG